jgi:hypothetical protein
MDRVAAQTLRVLGIVAISIVIIVAALIFAIASICGLWSSTSSGDQSAKLVIGLVCPAVLIVGIFLIAKLAKGIARTRRAAYDAAAAGAPATAIPPQPRDFAAEEEPLLHLRIAVGARILLSAAMVTYQRVQQSSSPYNAPYLKQALVAAVIGFFLYEAPNAFILWRIRERLERFAVLLAVAYAGVSIVWTMWNFTVYFRFMHNPHMLPTWLLPLAAEIAVVVTGWRARMALPRQSDDDSTFAAAGAIAFVYTFLAYGLTSFLYRMKPF